MEASTLYHSEFIAEARSGHWTKETRPLSLSQLEQVIQSQHLSGEITRQSSDISSGNTNFDRIRLSGTSTMSYCHIFVLFHLFSFLPDTNYIKFVLFLHKLQRIKTSGLPSLCYGKGSKAARKLHEESTKVFVETLKNAVITVVSVSLNCAVPSQVEWDQMKKNIIESYGNVTKVCMFL